MILRELLLKLGLEVDEAAFAKGELVAATIKSVFSKLAETLVENVKGAIEYGNVIAKTSQKIGIATDALQELQYAAKLSDVSAETMSNSIGILARNMAAAKEGSEEASKAFKGIEFKKANGQLKSADEVLATVADKFVKMPNGIEKTAQAMKLFGRGGKELIPLLNRGAAGIDKLREEARDLGLVLDKEAVESSEELNDNLERLSMISKGLWRSAIGPLLPIINKIVAKFIAWKKENSALIQQRIEKYIGYVGKALEFVSDTFTFLIKNAETVKVILYGLAAGFAVLQAASIAAAVASAAAWMLAAAPFVAIAGLIAGVLLVMNSIRRWKEGKQSAFGDFADQIAAWLKPNKNDPWWLASIKELVRYMSEALGLADRLGLAGKDSERGRADAPRQGLARAGQVATRALGVNPADISNALDRQFDSLAPLRSQLARGEKRAVSHWYGGTSYEDVSNPKERSKLAAEYRAQNPSSGPELRGVGGGTKPEYRGAGGGGSSVSVTAPVTIQVTQLPGQDGAALADDIKSQFDDHLQSTLQDASAQISGQ